MRLCEWHILSVSENVQQKRQHRCHFCPKVCTSLANLATHERIHTGEKPYQCEVCGKRFNHISNKKAHMIVHMKHNLLDI